jgi:hypothetical protein
MVHSAGPSVAAVLTVPERQSGGKRTFQMKHVQTVSRVPAPALNIGGGGGYGNTSIAETVIILVMTVLFNDWENFPSVIQNLQKYYSKTPN